MIDVYEEVLNRSLQIYNDVIISMYGECDLSLKTLQPHQGVVLTHYIKDAFYDTIINPIKNFIQQTNNIKLRKKQLFTEYGNINSLQKLIKLIKTTTFNYVNMLIDDDIDLDEIIYETEVIYKENYEQIHQVSKVVHQIIKLCDVFQVLASVSLNQINAAAIINYNSVNENEYKLYVFKNSANHHPLITELCILYTQQAVDNKQLNRSIFGHHIDNGYCFNIYDALSNNSKCKQVLQGFTELTYEMKDLINHYILIFKYKLFTINFIKSNIILNDELCCVCIENKVQCQLQTCTHQYCLNCVNEVCKKTKKCALC